jgi:hypothetical protein
MTNTEHDIALSLRHWFEGHAAASNTTITAKERQKQARHIHLLSQQPCSAFSATLQEQFDLPLLEECNTIGGGWIDDCGLLDWQRWEVETPDNPNVALLMLKQHARLLYHYHFQRTGATATMDEPLLDAFDLYGERN